MNDVNFTVGFWHPFGVHAGEAREEIIARKRAEIEGNGWTLWSFQQRNSLDAWRTILPESSPVFGAVDSYEIIESYPDDKYLPNYLVFATQTGTAFHVLFAVDVEEDHVRVVTAYRPNPDDWEPDSRTRRSKT